ncbi:nonspecific lipid-transfer protein [Trichoderma evansii]
MAGGIYTSGNPACTPRELAYQIKDCEPHFILYRNPAQTYNFKQASYCYGDSTCGQRVFYQFGLTRIPIYNVTAMVMARNFVLNGDADCILAVGLEKMSAGSLTSKFDDRTNPLRIAIEMSKKLDKSKNTRAPFAAQMFGNAAEEYIQTNGATAEDFAEIARINHEHSQQNPYSQSQIKYTKQQILDSQRYMVDGAAAAVVVSQAFLEERPHLNPQAIQLPGQCLATDSPSLYDQTAKNIVGYEMAKYAASQTLAQAQVTISDVKVVELHDCFSANEMLVIDALGLSPPGRAHEYVREGFLTYGSRHAVINPSGGLSSKGHPLGATGIAQCAELVWQLRGWANNRLVSVPAGKVALQQNAGLGGACVVTILKHADGRENRKMSDADVIESTGLGYNPAVEARGIRAEQAEKVRSRHRDPDSLQRL